MQATHDAVNSITVSVDDETSGSPSQGCRARHLGLRAGQALLVELVSEESAKRRRVRVDRRCEQCDPGRAQTLRSENAPDGAVKTGRDRSERVVAIRRNGTPLQGVKRGLKVGYGSHLFAPLVVLLSAAVAGTGDDGPFDAQDQSQRGRRPGTSPRVGSAITSSQVATRSWLVIRMEPRP